MVKKLKKLEDEYRAELKKSKEGYRADAADLAQLKAIRAESSIAHEPACVKLWNKIIQTRENDINGKSWARATIINICKRRIAELG